MATRNINADLKVALTTNVPFTYAHLIKFERPTTVSQYLGVSNTDGRNYTYLTDGAYDIAYNDASGNGLQIYRANKILSISGTNETVKAKASSMSLQIDCSTMDSQAVSPIVTTSGASASADGSLTSTNTNFVELGFREGDKVTLKDGNSNYNDISVIIKTFTNDGAGFNYTAVDTIPSTNNETLNSIDLVSEEITALTTSKTGSAYNSYLNREVFIYKVFMPTEPITINGNTYNPGQIIGGVGSNTDLQGGLLLFKGILSKANLVEGPKKSVINWTASSHWADFNRVQGRKTEDSTHRALNADGVPDRESAIRESYADDLGFLHSTTAINLTAVYNKTETRTEVDEDKMLGLFVTDVDTYEVEYDVPTELNLKFNLEAKYLPVVYGVQKVDTIPIFVDTRKNNSTEVHLNYALAEGTITGLYDIHIKDNPSVCIDKSDFDVRGDSQFAEDADGVIDVICRGRKDRGDVLNGYNSNTVAAAVVTSNVNEAAFSQTQAASSTLPLADTYQGSITTTLNTPVGETGILHERTISFDSPIDVHYRFHQGRPYQRAEGRLVQIAQDSNNFKLQNDYYDKKEVYYGPNHRLLDTAYLHGEYTISDGETEIPEIKAVLKGKSIECYNYDNSYSQDRNAGTSANHTQFEIGHTVTLHNTSNDATLISGNFTIVDKWKFYDYQGRAEYRFRLKDSNGDIANIPANSKFYMKKGSDKWYMVTYDGADVVNGTVPGALSAAVSSGGLKTIGLNSPSTAFNTALGLDDPSVKLVSNKNSSFIAGNFAGFTYSSPNISNLGTTTWTTDITTVLVGNGIRLPDTANNSDNDRYVDATLKFTRTLSNGTTYEQERIVTDYDPSQRICIVDAPWDSNYIPGYNIPTGATDSVSVFIVSDLRPSINPAMQLLDYLKSKRYGKGLKSADIDLASFLAAGKVCDAQSDVSVVAVAANAANASVGDTFFYGTAGSPKNFFQGKISSITTKTVGGLQYKEITFTDVIGKLGYKWNTYTTWTAGQLIWDPSSGAVKTAQAGVQTSFTGSNVTSLNLTKLGTSDTISLEISTFKAGNNNPIVKGFSTNSNTFNASGYSLYDCDDIKYWKYIGWDEPTQRHATRHQMNQSINTSQSIFSNVNKMLEQFNGILRYSLGKYQLAIKAKKGTVEAAEQISQGDIIGDIKLTDRGARKTYNSANLAFPDPQNKFDSREISFFNSKFLKEDKGIPKNLSYQARGITNYFNARYNLVQKLNESRFGSTINFKVGPRGYALLPGEIIEVTYPRFGWTSKEFRVTTLNFSKDCLVSVTADEHDDSAYSIERTQLDVEGRFEPGGLPIKPTPDSPTNLTTSAPSAGGIALTWVHSASFSPRTHTVQVWKSSTNSRSVTIATTANSSVNGSNSAHTDVTVSSNTGISTGQLVRYRNSPANITVQAINGTTITLNQSVEILSGTDLVFFNATLVAEVNDQQEYIDPILSASNSVTNYYWVRYRITEQLAGTNAAAPKDRFSPFHPTSATGGVSGQSQPSAAPRTVKVLAGGSGITGNVVTYDVNSQNPSPSSITMTAVVQNNAGTVAYNWTKATPGGSFGSSLGTSSTLTYSPPSALSGLPELIKCEITDTLASGAQHTASDILEVYGTRVVADGTNGTDGTDATNHASVSAYVRTNTTSFTTKPSAITWTFATASGSSFSSNGGVTYSYTVPSGTEPLYICTAVASGTGSTDTIASNDWSAPQLISGSNTAIVFAYRRSSSTLTDQASDKPATARTWSFNTGTWSDNDLGNSYSGIVPAGTDDIYICTAIANSSEYEDQVDVADWSAPRLLGKVGADGDAAFYVVSRLPAFGFSANSAGTISDTTGFSNTFTVKKGTQAFTYDGSSPYSANTFRSGTLTPSQTSSTDDVTINTAADGTLTIATSGSPFLAGTSILDAHFDIQIVNNADDTVIATMRTSLIKSLSGGGRGPGRFIIEESTAGTNTLPADVTNFVNASFTSATTARNASAANIAQDVIGAAADGLLQPGDIITVTDNSANLAGTRIYNGSSATSTHGNVTSNLFSALVVETFPGSVIVDGTLSASKISTGTISSATVTVHDNLIVGGASNAGAVHSHGKTNSSVNTNGFFLGVDSSGNADFAIGGGGNSSTLLDKDGLIVKDAGGTIRVALGNLTNLLS